MNSNHKSFLFEIVPEVVTLNVWVLFCIKTTVQREYKIHSRLVKRLYINTKNIIIQSVQIFADVQISISDAV